MTETSFIAVNALLQMSDMIKTKDEATTKMLKHILFLDIYIVIGHFIVFLECDPLACNREVFSGIDHEIPENVFLFDRM